MLGKSKIVGVLSLQGAVGPHLEHLQKIGVVPKQVFGPKDLADIHGLILPGGESTTMLKLAQELGLWEELKSLSRKIPFWGICAGSILMAREVENPSQPSLGVMDLKVRRNAYGRQLDSFQGDVLLSDGTREPAVFIRAPKFVSWGAGVREMGRVPLGNETRDSGEVAYLDDGIHMVTAFHPELTESSWCHQRFLSKL